jgi:hypothetical protein
MALNTEDQRVLIGSKLRNSLQFIFVCSNSRFLASTIDLQQYLVCTQIDNRSIMCKLFCTFGVLLIVYP